MFGWKKIVSWMLVVMLTVAMTGCGQKQAEAPPPTATEVKTISTIFQFTENSQAIADLDQKIEAEAGVTVMAVLKAHYTVEEQDGFVTAINGHNQDKSANKYWMFKVNGTMAEKGAADIVLNDGDVVLWELSVLK